LFGNIVLSFVFPTFNVKLFEDAQRIFMVLLLPFGLIEPDLHPDPSSIHFPPIQTEP
jgi:hypothetical protein